VGEKEDELGKARWRIGELEGFLNQRDARLGEWESSYHNLTNEKDAEIARLTARLGELGALNSEVAARDARLVEWEARYRGMTTEKDNEIARLTARLAELGTVSARLSEADGELARLRLRISELEAGVSEGRRHVLLYREQEAEVRRLNMRIAELEAAAKLVVVAARQEPKVSTRDQMELYRKNPPGRGQFDDLKLIYGVGPVLEKMLHQLGIYYFKQVALWNEDDIDYVDDRLEHFKGRIRREGWVPSAKEEHFKKYSERL
jgi:predicted flap endonuclease-1-like 5' DNA nuclease